MTPLTPLSLLESLRIKPEEKATRENMGAVYNEVWIQFNNADLQSGDYSNNYEWMSFRSNEKGWFTVRWTDRTILSVLTEIINWVEPKKGGSE